MTETANDRRIISLLRDMRDLEGTSTSGTGSRDGGDRILHMPGGAWEASGCDELDRLLTQLKLERPSQWWHVTERYRRSDIRARTVQAKRTHSGRLIVPKLGPHAEALGEGIRLVDSATANELRIVIETWAPAVRAEKAQRGIRYLSNRFPFNNFKHRDLEPVAA